MAKYDNKVRSYCTMIRYLDAVCVLFTFRFLLHQKAGHALLFSHHKGDIARFIRGDHLQGQAVNSALAAHLIQVVVLEEIVPEPPFSSRHPRVRQLHLEHSVLPGGHRNIVELPEDAHVL